MPFYESEFATIYLGDCRDVFAQIGPVDHVVTDPPYDLSTHLNATQRGANGRLSNDPIPLPFDSASPCDIVPPLLAASKRWTVAFCSLEMLGGYRDASGEAWVRAGFWRRPDGSPQFTGDRPGQPGEGIAIMHRPQSAGRTGRTRWNGGGRHAYYEVMTVKGASRVHPTQKPEALMAAILEDFTDPGDLILDPYMGSGTTLVAAARLGRRVIGIERSEEYCQLAVRRLAQAPLFSAGDFQQGAQVGFEWSAD